MSSQAEVRDLAAAVLDAYPRLDVLVNNAGGFYNTRHVTVDGLERTFALNHLAGFLLTELLLDRLKTSAPARIVTVSSNGHAMGKLNFDDLQSEKSYSGRIAYANSKLANIFFTYELARRLDGSGVTATVLHPGLVRTALSSDDPSKLLNFPDLPGKAGVEVTSPGRRHLYLPGIRAGGRGSHRPVFRRPQAEDLKEILLRHRCCRPALAGQRRADRRLKTGASPGDARAASLADHVATGTCAGPVARLDRSPSAP